MLVLRGLRLVGVALGVELAVPGLEVLECFKGSGGSNVSEVCAALAVELGLFPKPKFAMRAFLYFSGIQYIM